MNKLSSQDRSALIRLASTLPVGSTERKAILAGLSKTSSGEFNIPGKHILDSAQVSGKARVLWDAEVSENAKVYGNAEVSTKAKVWGSAQVYDDAKVLVVAKVYDNASVYGNAKVAEYARAYCAAPANYRLAPPHV